MTRVTHLGSYLRLQGNLDQASTALARTRTELASGRRVVGYADAPPAAVQASRLGAELATIEALDAAAADGLARLSRQDDALRQMSDVLMRVRELAISAVSGSATPANREAIAAELDQLRAYLVELANTKENGQALFGGFAATAVTDSPTGASFSGDSGAVQRRVGPDHVLTVNIDGAAAFGFAAGDDVFSVVADLATAVRAADTATLSTAGLARLGARADTVRVSLGQTGNLVNDIERATATNGTRAEAIRRQRSALVDTDYAEAALDLGRHQTAYEAALASASRLQQSPSLMDYLR